MADGFRYSLTRVCLQAGSITLPLKLLGVFPERGEVLATDSQKGAEFTLQVEGRQVRGLEAFYREHELIPGDDVLIAMTADGGYSLTAAKRQRREGPSDSERRASALVEEVLSAGVPLSEGEIRTLHAKLVVGLDIRATLAADPRLAIVQGRWQSRIAAEEAREAQRQRAAERSQLSYSELEALDARPARSAPASAPAAAASPSPASPSPSPVSPSPAVAPAASAARHPAPDPEAIKASLRESARIRAAAAAAAAAEASAEAAAGSKREAPSAEQAQRPPASQGAESVPTEAESSAVREARIRAMVEADELRATIEEASGELDPLDFARERTRKQLAAHAYDDAVADARRQRDERTAQRRSEQTAEGGDTFRWDQPLGRRIRFPWSWWRSGGEAAAEEIKPNQDPLRLDRLGEPQPVGRREASETPRVTPAPSAAILREEGTTGTLPPGDPAATKRAREIFVALGFRVEGLAHGQLMLHADYGRRFERMLIHVLPEGERLEWAPLLGRRRESGANFLAVVGEDRDLVKQTATSELAKATLWSWSGLARVVDLAQSMRLSPFDLRGHFERDGLFEYGLDRFERTVARRVQERGALSAVLERLASMRPPAIFMLEDIASEASLPRDQTLRALEHLAEAPWQLVTRVDSGEFCLLYRPADALQGVSEYVDSMRSRLPEPQRELLRGVVEDVDPIEAEELVVTEAPPTPATPLKREAKEPLVVAARGGRVAEQPLLIPVAARSDDEP